jgi:phosphoribosylformimino-5-aminoimidazole carboxamide ribotide isomerase
MQIVPVIDLKQGNVVRGIGGRRTEYRPIVSSLAEGHKPVGIAEALVRTFDIETIYVADLDAIESSEPDFDSWRAIADCGVKLWIDAGTVSPHRTRLVAESLGRAAISGSVVVGLESLPSSTQMGEIFQVAGNEPIFSLDLREGRPLARHADDQEMSPLAWAAEAVQVGFQRLIVLDLADVGTGRGTGTLDLCRAIRSQYPQAEIISGGGARHVSDLQELAGAGCSAALVASALHDGRVTRDDCESIRHR